MSGVLGEFLWPNEILLKEVSDNTGFNPYKCVLLQVVLQLRFNLTVLAVSGVLVC